MVRLVRRQVFEQEGRNRDWQAEEPCILGQTRDFLFLTDSDSHNPSLVFDRLRWGGVFAFISAKPRLVEAVAMDYRRFGFAMEQAPAAAVCPRRLLGMRLPFPGRKVHYFAARKMHMVPPGTFTDRFTYDVFLERASSREEPLVVVKRVPDFDALIERLRQRSPSADEQAIRKHARKLHETVFPVFLTREAGFLKVLQEHLPETYCARVPRVIDMEVDGRGMVSRMRLNWLRKTTRQMGQLEFAIQSADLLSKIHELARVIHLDLRLDNFVVSDHGVGFVDYGSSARDGEDIATSPLLSHLFTQIMKTSQIQRMLEQLTNDGQVTSSYLAQGRRQVDKAVDVFYLAVQMDQPHSNPYMREVVRYAKRSGEAQAISRLSAEVLRPLDPRRPTYTSASALLTGLLAVRELMGRG
jgi:tRNA A-37 threonylcarbamoyl transferase component Bud32